MRKTKREDIVIDMNRREVTEAVMRAVRAGVRREVDRAFAYCRGDVDWDRS